MTEDFKNKIDLSKPRRKYFSEECKGSLCPECGKPLIEHGCTVVIAVKSDTDEGEFMSNLTGSHFCETCPVVVFDSDRIELAASLAINSGANLKYLIGGIVNYNAIPLEKRHLEVGSDDNPIPIADFLPDLNKTTITKRKKIGRNSPCSCGSGKKYKKCCLE